MQERLTLWQTYLKATDKSKKSKSIRIVFIVFVVAFIFLLFTIFLTSNKNNTWIKEDEYYFVVVGDNLSLASAQAYKKQIEESGGAGELMSTTQNNLYSVIIFAYKNKNDAEKVQKSSEGIFPHCYLISKKVNEIYNKTQNTIKNISGVFESIELVNSLYNSAAKTLFDFEKGQLEYSNLSRFAVSISDKLQRTQNKIIENDEFSVFIRSSLISLNSYLGEFVKDGITGSCSLVNFRKFCVNALVQTLEINQRLLQFQ